MEGMKWYKIINNGKMRICVQYICRPVRGVQRATFKENQAGAQ